MKEEIKKLSNQDLLDLYNLLLKHKEYLELEKTKVGEAKDD